MTWDSLWYNPSCSQASVFLRCWSVWFYIRKWQISKYVKSILHKMSREFGLDVCRSFHIFRTQQEIVHVWKWLLKKFRCSPVLWSTTVYVILKHKTHLNHWHLKFLNNNGDLIFNTGSAILIVVSYVLAVFLNFRDSVMTKPPLLQCTLCLYWRMDRHNHPHTYAHTNTHNVVHSLGSPAATVCV